MNLFELRIIHLLLPFSCLDKTVITKGPEDFSFSKGSVANLFCEHEYESTYTDEQTFTYTFDWFKDGKPVEFDERVHEKKGKIL